VGVGPGSTGGSISHRRSRPPSPAYHPVGVEPDLRGEHGERERVPRSAREDPVEPHPFHRRLVGAQAELVGQQGREPVGGGLGVALRGGREQLAGQLVEPEAHRCGIAGPELGGDREQHQARRRARVVGQQTPEGAGFRRDGIPGSTVGHGIPTEGIRIRIRVP
jgi:hypothetical protein